MSGLLEKLLNAIWRPEQLKKQYLNEESNDVTPYFDDDPIISKSEAMPWERDENDAFN